MTYRSIAIVFAALAISSGAAFAETVTNESAKQAIRPGAGDGRVQIAQGCGWYAIAGCSRTP